MSCILSPSHEKIKAHRSVLSSAWEDQLLTIMLVSTADILSSASVGTGMLPLIIRTAKKPRLASDQRSVQQRNLSWLWLTSTISSELTDVHIFGLRLTDFFTFPLHLAGSNSVKIQICCLHNVVLAWPRMANFGSPPLFMWKPLPFFTDVIYLLTSCLSIPQSACSNSGFLPIYTSLTGEGRILSLPYHPLSHHLC